jgi:iron complex outermembrane receptor protein
MRNLLLGSTSFLLALGAAGYAHAQSAPAKPAVAIKSSGIEDIVITAQKRKERLQATTVSVQTLQAATLANSNVSDISDLSKLIPSASIQGTTNGRVPYAMRGITTTANEGNVGLSSGVAILVDGVSIPSDSHAADQIEDVQNIQVLKGPQATLGGRSASAGVVAITTRGPTSIWTGDAGATFTTDNEKRGNFFLAGPLTDQLSMSISGYGNETPYPIYNEYNGKYTTVTNYGVRGKLQYKPNNDLTITLNGHFSKDQSYGDNFVYTYIDPGSALLSSFLQPPFGPPGINFSVPGLMGNIKPHYGNLTADSIAQNEGAIITARDVTLNIDQRLGDLDLTSTTAYQSESEKDIQDLFVVNQYFFTELTGGAAPFNNNQDIRNNVSQFSEELRLASPSTDKLNYIVGFYFSNSRIDSLIYRGLAPASENLHVQPDTKTADIYARTTYNFTPHIAVTGGLRANYDMLSYSYLQTAYAPFTIPGDPAAPPQNSAGSYNAGVLVGDISAKYTFNRNAQAYVTYTRGYAPSAYNTASPLFTSAPLKPVARMDINDFEVGTKGTYFDHTLLINADAFYTLFDNYQIEAFSNIPGLLNPPLVLSSAPKVQTHGLEVDGTWRATDALTINLNAAYIDATFVTWHDAPCIAASACIQSVDGKTLPNSPKLKFTLDTNYDLPLPFFGGMDLVFDGNYAYRTSAEMTPDQNPYTRLPAFGILNLNLTAQFDGGKYSAQIFVDNVGNTPDYVDVEDFWDTVWSSPTGSEHAANAQPGRDSRRYAGIKLNAKF